MNLKLPYKDMPAGNTGFASGGLSYKLRAMSSEIPSYAKPRTVDFLPTKRLAQALFTK